MKISENVRKQLLLSQGVSPDEFWVEVTPTLGGKATRPILGRIARAIESCLKKRTPFAISLYAELSRSKSAIVLVKRDRWKERLQTALHSLPYVGIGVGLLVGLSSRDSLSRVSKGGVSDHPFLQGIHAVKQWEIKNIAYLTPFIIPSFFHWKKHFNLVKWGLCKDQIVQILTTDKIQEKKEVVSGKFCVKGIEALFKTFTNRIMYTGSLLVFGLGTPVYTVLSRLLLRGFDPSGHFLLKTVSASLLSQELTALAKTTSRRGQIALLGYAAIYALTDAVLLYHTASRFHTVPEVLCGLAAGVGFVQFAKRLHNRTTLGNPLDS